MNHEEEKKNRLLGVLASLTVHVLLIVLFLFVMGFTAPNPPLSEQGSGVELQLGVDAEGSGDVQQPVAITPTETPDENTPVDAQKEEMAVTEQPKVNETQSEPDKPKEELSSDEESPVAAKEVKKEIKKEKKVEPPKEKVVKKEVKNPLAEYKAPTDSKDKKDAKESGKKDGAEKQKNSKGVSQGDDKGKTGDKGSPDGVADSKGAYTGKAGTGGEGTGGGGISMSGFEGFERPKINPPNVPEESYGTYVFIVTVNSEGEIEKIKPENRGLSLEAENIFKKLIQNTEFTPLNSNLPAHSEGRITFKIVAGKNP